MSDRIEYIDSTPAVNAFLLRCFKTIKDNIVIEKLNKEDKDNYYDCCKMLIEYESMLKGE